MRRLWLVAIGLLNVSGLLGAPLAAQRRYVAQPVLPVVVGLWLVLIGVYTLRH